MSATTITSRPSTAPSAWPGGRKSPDKEHDYLRQHVDPVLMPLIEALLLYQPESIYEFIHDYVDEAKASRFTMHPPRAGYAKKLTYRRKMVDFMSTSVIPVMDDLAHQILREKPNSVKEFIKEIVAARIIVGTSATFESNQHEEATYSIGDRVLSRYKGRPRYYPGVITAMNASGDLFTIAYDDGKSEQNVHLMCIKPAAIDSDRSDEAATSTARTTESVSSSSSKQNLQIVILMIGIDGAGKTTLLSTLQGDLEKEHVPSAGFTSATFQMENGAATFYDLGGGPAFRNVWSEYYADAHGILFVVDSSRENSVHESARVLEDAMAHPMMANKPLLIFANKCDHPNAVSDHEVADILNLATYSTARVVGCVAKPSANGNMVDDRLEYGLHWLFDQVQRQFEALDARVQADFKWKKQQDAQRRADQRARVASWKEERERNEMLLHDKLDVQDAILHAKAAEEAAKAAAQEAQPQDDQEVIKCSNCVEKPAETKCAASKWMPVCGDCAAQLKANQAS